MESTSAEHPRRKSYCIPWCLPSSMIRETSCLPWDLTSSMIRKTNVIVIENLYKKEKKDVKMTFNFNRHHHSNTLNERKHHCTFSHSFFDGHKWLNFKSLLFQYFSFFLPFFPSFVRSFGPFNQLEMQSQRFCLKS